MAALLALFLAAAVAQSGGDTFAYPPPTGTAKSVRLYATRYYVHYLPASAGSGASQLLARDGHSLGVSISDKDFCFGALQGTVAVRSGADTAVYNVDGLAPKRSADCAYARLSSDVNDRLGRQAWAKLSGNGRYGLGVNGLRLVPFRTIAVDRNTLPIGTVLFLPRLKGWAFSDEGGHHVHDGYVIAGDVGGAIKGQHVDFFTGNYTGPPPAFVTSTASGLFDARIVTDPAIVSGMRANAKYRP